ncbi:hypothetical protein NKG94_07075 [Micromonospora sp. M12]
MTPGDAELVVLAQAGTRRRSVHCWPGTRPGCEPSRWASSATDQTPRTRCRTPCWWPCVASARSATRPPSARGCGPSSATTAG